jgi:transcriptional regulator with XRE-family HTH domain
MDTKETLGFRIQRLRLAAGLTQVQLATEANVTIHSLRNWEIDRREPSLRQGYRLAKVLGVTADHLAEAVPVEEVGKTPRPAGPTRRPAPVQKKRGKKK